MMSGKPVATETNRDAVLLITTVASFMIAFMGSAVNIALPAISKEFQLDIITLGWVSTSYMVASSSMLIPFGRLADMYGRRKLFIIGTIVFLAGSILTATSVSGPMLLAARAVQGIGGAAIFSTAVAILTSAFPPLERGRVLGINTAAVYTGLSLGPFLGGLLTEYAGWKSIFTIAAVMTVVVIIATFWKLHGEMIEKKAEKFDLPGSIIYAAALILAMYGVSRLPSTGALGFIGGGIILAVAFFVWEMNIRHPLLNLVIFRKNRGFTYSNLAALVHYSGTFAVSFLLSLYLQYARGLQPKVAGFILISSPVVQALWSPLFGKLSDRREPRLLASLGMGLTALGIGLLSFVSQTTPYWYIIGCLALLGFGFALFSSPNSNAVMGSAEPRYYGIASSLLATMRQLGMMVSMGISWAVLAVVMGRVEIKPEYYPELITSVRIAFVISSVLCAGAIYFSVARGNIHPATQITNRNS